MPSPPPLRLLQLEENARDAGLALALLAEEGILCRVTRVATLADFLAHLETGQPFDLVLSNHSPAVDGLAALAACKQARPHLPFIFASATPDGELAAQALAKGAADYVLKSRLSRLAPAVNRVRLEAQERLAAQIAAPGPRPVPAVADASRSPEPSPARGTETILLAEDDQLVRTLIRDVLNRFGYRVIEAADGLEALAKFEQYREEIALVVLDRVLPRKNGDEALLAMRALHPRLPALLISGYPETWQEPVEAEPGESSGFLAKPFAPVQLLHAIHELLEPPQSSGRSSAA
jgi:CheY-like chemotaxis protein